MKRIYFIVVALLSMSLLSCQKEDSADYQIYFSGDNDWYVAYNESPKSKEVYDYIRNELIGTFEKQHPDMQMTISVKTPGSADLSAIHTFDYASEELRRIEKTAKDLVRLSLNEDTDTGNFAIAYKLTLYCMSSDHRHSSPLREAHFFVEYKGGEWKE